MGRFPNGVHLFDAQRVLATDEKEGGKKGEGNHIFATRWGQFTRITCKIIASLDGLERQVVQGESQAIGKKTKWVMELRLVKKGDERRGSPRDPVKA